MKEYVRQMWAIYTDHIEPFEAADDKFGCEAGSYYWEWANARDHFENAKRAITDVGRGAKEQISEIWDGMITLGVASNPEIQSKRLMGQGDEATNIRIEGFNQGVTQMVKDPIGTSEAVVQSVSDKIEEEGLAYGLGYLGTDVSIGLITKKMMGSTKGVDVSQMADATGDTASAMSKLDDIVDTAEDMSGVANKVDDVADMADDIASHTDEILEGGGTSVVYGTDDISSYQYNMFENPGPLAQVMDNPAKNFYGGRYNLDVLAEDTIYYRAGQSGKPLGQWFTTEVPESVAKVRIDTAVKPQWIDPVTGELTGTSLVDTVYAIKVPKGTATYTGPVGPQGGAYCGGYDKLQTFIETPWKIDGVEVVDSFPLR